MEEVPRGHPHSGTGPVSTRPTKASAAHVPIALPLFPKLYHELVFAEKTAKSLEVFDRLERATVHTWLPLPHDTPTGYFHVKALNGGLGVPRLRYTMPLLKTRRMGKVEELQDQVTQRRNKATLSGARRRYARTARVAGQELSNSKNASDFLAIQLHISVDGRGLKQQGKTPHSKRLGDLWVLPPWGGTSSRPSS